jgi:membrane dipeptidase
MDRREFTGRIAGAAAAAAMLRPARAGAVPLLAAPGSPLPHRQPGGAAAPAWDGYGRAMVVDALAGPLQFNIPQGELPLSAAVLEHLRASGITGINLTTGVVGATAPRPFEDTVARLAAWEREMDRHRDVLQRVRRASDLDDAKAGGRLGVIYGFQDAVPLEGRLDRLELFHGLGVRIVQLTYNDRNRLGDGCLEPADAGLSRLGHEAVTRMDELGILVDLSHCGRRTTVDGIRASTRPVSITHSGCSALFEHPRNKDDATLRLLAEGGGVVGIYLMPFLNPSGPPEAEHVIDHVEHALDVCGEDHVGIGSDQGITPLDVGGDFQARFDAVSERRQAMGIAAPREDTTPYVADLNTPRRLERIADLMLERGHAERVVEKVVGANFRRLFGEVWHDGPPSPEDA